MKDDEMLKNIVPDKINEVVNHTSLVGLIIGIIHLVLDKEKTSWKEKIASLIYTIIFSIGTGLLMRHFVSIGEATEYLEWVVIGVISYNQRPIRALISLMFMATMQKPFETLKKLRDLIKGE